jgi:UDP-glucuronate 4-epimerase
VQPRLLMLPTQPSDVSMTCADVKQLRARAGFEPLTPLNESLRRFVAWFRGKARWQGCAEL